MALNRRATQRMSGSIWPGFVDAMTALLLVLMFVLTIFMIVQYILRETITGQEDALSQLNRENSSLEQANAGLSGALTNARAETEAQRALVDLLTTQTQEQGAELDARAAMITEFESKVASLLGERDAALSESANLSDAIIELDAENQSIAQQRDALELALARARTEIDREAEAARLAAARREALAALTADLRQRIEARDLSLSAALAELSETQDEDSGQNAEIRELTNALAEEEAARLREAAAAEALRARLEDADTELTAMTLRLEEERRRAEETLTLLAAAEAEADQSLDERTAQQRETVRQKRLLALAQERLSEEEAVSAEAKRQQQLLNAQVRELRGELNRLQGLLDLAKAEDAAAQVRIETLGADLNQALARVAAEQTKRAELEEAERKRLERYQSEFFGQLRDLLGDREGVRIVGDRFVFSSEVLFDSGSADLSDEGRAQIARVAQILSDVSGDIPDNIDWVVRVDGHTDNRPIVNASTYANNWELSQARALSVVLFMIGDLGFPTRRLAATGFGEFQPVAEGDSAAARAQNRRIELKLTER
ncbi:MAG: peptidoglycan -binding protein [Rhodobacteraceae bacterium]|nr:peptidoglycan -binding protein [Paracoccaceae bacterium]